MLTKFQFVQADTVYFKIYLYSQANKCQNHLDTKNGHTLAFLCMNAFLCFPQFPKRLDGWLAV